MLLPSPASQGRLEHAVWSRHSVQPSSRNITPNQVTYRSTQSEGANDSSSILGCFPKKGNTLQIRSMLAGKLAGKLVVNTCDL